MMVERIMGRESEDRYRTLSELQQQINQTSERTENLLNHTAMSQGFLYDGLNNRVTLKKRERRENVK